MNISFSTNETESDTEFKPRSLLVHFRSKVSTVFGEIVSVVGNKRELGSWNPNLSLSLRTSKEDYPVWTGSLEIQYTRLPVQFEYKLCILRNGQARWESFPLNREFELRSMLPPGHSIELEEEFNLHKSHKIEIREVHSNPILNSIALSYPQSWGDCIDLVGRLILSSDLSVTDYFYISCYFSSVTENYLSIFSSTPCKGVSTANTHLSIFPW